LIRLWRAHVHTAINLRVPYNARNFWTSWGTISFSRSTVFRVVTQEPFNLYWLTDDKVKDWLDTGHVWGKSDACRILVWKDLGNLLLVRPTLTCKDDIKIGPKETGWCDVDRIHVAENRGGCEHGIASSFPAVWGIWLAEEPCHSLCLGTAVWWAEAGTSICVCMRARWSN